MQNNFYELGDEYSFNVRCNRKIHTIKVVLGERDLILCNHKEEELELQKVLSPDNLPVCLKIQEYFKDPVKRWSKRIRISSSHLNHLRYPQIAVDFNALSAWNRGFNSYGDHSGFCPKCLSLVPELIFFKHDKNSPEYLLIDQSPKIRVEEWLQRFRWQRWDGFQNHFRVEFLRCSSLTGKIEHSKQTDLCSFIEEVKEEKGRKPAITFSSINQDDQISALNNLYSGSLFSKVSWK